jgi:two-component system, LuxR family, response regulator FixJ
MTERTIFLVDDNAEFRASAQWWLRAAGYRVREFADPTQALATLRQLAADEPAALHDACLLLDVRMPGMSGLDLHDALADCGVTRTPHAVPVVYMSGHGDVPLAVQAMQKGAVTFIEKPFADEALEAALAQAFAAGAAVQADLALATAGLPADAPDASAADPAQREFQRRLESLSPRQREVFEGVVAGKLSKVIAYESGLSPKTVEFHRKQMMLKFRARTALELMRMAVAQRVDETCESAVQAA